MPKTGTTGQFPGSGSSINLRVDREKFILDTNVYYGEQEIFFNDDNIIVFDMRVKGKYILESHNPQSFIMLENNGRIIGFSTGGSVGKAPFLKYKGDLLIITCTISKLNGGLEQALPLRERTNKFNASRDSFSGEGGLFEELTSGVPKKIYSGKPKAIWVNENLSTRGGEYILDGNNYIGDYHLHQDGIVMTGATKSEESKELKKVIDIMRIKRISKTIKAFSQSSRGGSTMGGGY